MRNAVKNFTEVSKAYLSCGREDMEQKFIQANDELCLKTGAEYHQKFFTEILKRAVKESREPRELLEQRVSRLINLTYG